MENNDRYLESCSAGQRSGLIYTPVNSYLTAEELAYIIDNSESTALITSRSKRDVALEAADACARLTHVLVVDDDGTSGGPPSCRLRDRVVRTADNTRTDERWGWAMLYSSGTTGRPKGITRPIVDQPPDAPSLLFSFLSGLWRYREDMVYLSPAPLYHSAPQAAVAATIMIAGTAIMMERFDPVDYLRLIEHYQVTHSQLVPTMFSRMLKLPAQDRSRYDLSSLEVATHAAAPCPVPVKEAMIEWWGQIIHEYYGVGYVDEDGFLNLTDRKTFMVISGGVNIYPQEMENLLITHPKVADAAVFGVPNVDLGEEVKAVVQPMPGIAPDDALTEELLAFCRQHLTRQKVPRFIDYIDELPRLPTGKLYKKALRDQYWGDGTSRIV